MKIRILIALLLLAKFSFALPADVPVNSNNVWNGESSLIVNPANPQEMVAAWIKKITVLQAQIAVSRTTDGGQTWSNPQLMPHFGNILRTSADPTFAYSNSGILYLGYVDYKITRDSGGAYICNSTDFGQSWSTPVRAVQGEAFSDKPIDRPWLAVDNSGGTYNGRLYLSTKAVNEALPPRHVYITYSNDQGQNWSPIVIVDSTFVIGTLRSDGKLTVAPNGALHISYLSWDFSESFFPQLIDAVSTNGSATFNRYVIQTSVSGSAFASTDTLYQFSNTISVNPQNANELIAVYSDNRNGDPDLLYSRTTDGGMTWTAAARLNDDALGNGIGQDMCWAEFSANGNYAAGWRDRRTYGAGQAADYEIWGAFSSNGGNTFSPIFKISSGGGPLFTPVSGNDFLGLIVHDTTICVSWADKRNTNNQVFFNCYQASVITGLPETKKPAEGFSVFPNPATNEITIRAEAKSYIELIDSQGKLILQKQMENNTLVLSLEKLPAGLYLIRSGNETKRLQVYH